MKTDKTFQTAFLSLIEEGRKALGISVSELGRRAFEGRIKDTNRTITLIRAGKRGVPLEDAYYLAKAIGTDLDRLCFRVIIALGGGNTPSAE